MSAIVEMFRDARAPKGRNRFSCPMPIWELLSELGRAFGWQPKGTTYVLPSKSTVEAPARRDYQPGGSQDHKRVEGEDAVGWARALEVAKGSPHAAAMIDARSAALVGSGKAGGEMLPACSMSSSSSLTAVLSSLRYWSEDTRGAEPDSTP